MHERPIGDLVDALRATGARIDYLGAKGYPPLAIHPGRIAPGQTVRVRGDVSSQYLSALLMALPLAGGGTIAVEGELISKPYVEITLNLMQRFGVEVRRTGWSRFDVPGTAYASPGAVLVEGDASAASYFLAAGAIGGGPVRVEGVGRASIQGDVRFCEVLEKMGARVTMGEDWIEASGRALRAFDLDLNHIPDAAMTAAVACSPTAPARAQHRELARQGDRSHRRDGEGTGQARRARRSRRGLPQGGAAQAQRRGRGGHLRRPPHGDEPLARRARGRRRAYQ
jgi:3-phosphoshikimate 1-carboxyvinyltransferase